MKGEVIALLIITLSIVFTIFPIGNNRAEDVSVYNTDNFEIMHGYYDNGEIEMEDEGHTVSGTKDEDGHLFLYNYKTGCYIEGDVDEYGQGQVYDYATGQYYDINID